MKLDKTFKWCSVCLCATKATNSQQNTKSTAACMLWLLCTHHHQRNFLQSKCPQNSTRLIYPCDAPDSDDSSAWNSGSRWSASISSGPTRRCSDLSEWADRFDRLDRVDLSLDRVDCRSIRFLLTVRRSSLLLDVVVVIHGCFSACTALSRTVASTTNNLSMKSRAWTDTSFHACQHTHTH